MQKLRRMGFESPYAGGRHLFMCKGELKMRIPNPHQSDISGGLIAEILREAHIDPVNWEKA